MSSPDTTRQLQPEQTAAAYAIDRHISVTAGPGSGKTTVLVERYLHILRQQDLSIDQIVAITFTNRAANEMRERLRQQLNYILSSVAVKERPRWLHYKRTLDGAVITTIHGFCARLLREFPVEARVDPQFLLLDEHRAAMLLESVVEETLREFISGGHVPISRLTLGVGRGKLATALAQIYRDIRGQGLSFAELALKTAASHATEADYAAACFNLDRRMDQFLNGARLTVKAEAKRRDAAAEWPGLRETLASLPNHAALSEYCLAIERFRAFRPDKTAVGELAPQLDELLWGNVSKRPNDYSGLVPQICFDLFAKEYALEVVNLLGRIDERLEEEKQKLSALDFDDLELRALKLLDQPEVKIRAAERYKFFLVDEFQDTNQVQRRLLEALALQKSRRESANLFIVGDRKQSIYGFRGADVDVFRTMTETLKAAGGAEKPLRLNFRSQPPLINFFNFLFARLFRPLDELSPEVRDELGYVAPEPSEAKRELRDEGPLVELLIETEASSEKDDPKAEQSSRELDAEQLAHRIIKLTAGIAGGRGPRPSISAGVLDPPANVNQWAQAEGGRDARGPSGGRDAGPSGAPGARGPGIKYSDIALLFRAMTQVQTYEAAFRRANIPYQTILGRGFYERPEITDLIQLLRFLDNKTDEIALAAVLRSPLFGLSDNALLALRCASKLTEAETGDPLRRFNQTRKLLQGLAEHREIAFINDESHDLLDRAQKLIGELVERRHHHPIGSLLRFAVEQSEYETVIAATFDGAQRLANVRRLFTLAERFERSGDHLIRDFVRYVEEFEAIGSRESEGQIDEAANAVRLMTIHQAKGLEFPVVIIPELQRYSKKPDDWFLLDRHRGLTLKVPDGRGRLVPGCTFNDFYQRDAWREQFESMRLLYVAATRAQDRLILSGTTKTLESLGGKIDSWLRWIWQSLELQSQTKGGVIDLAAGVQLQLMLNLSAEVEQEAPWPQTSLPEQAAEEIGSLSEAFPLLSPIVPEVPQSTTALHRFSVTQLINYRRCPRQYYFERVLHLPDAEEMAVWNDAEAPEPPANLTATLKGAVIHRFCETFLPGDEAVARLQASFDDLIRLRQARLADRIIDIDPAKAVAELLPLAEHYLSSDVFQRVGLARAAASPESTAQPTNHGGLWSELSFRLRRPLGILTGTIDKLLITPVAGGGFEIEIIDFKTNRIRVLQTNHAKASPPKSRRAALGPRASRPPGRKSAPGSEQQIAFAFARSEKGSFKSTDALEESSISLRAEVARVASDYELQMQAYALAVRELLPSATIAGASIEVTLHFLDPNVEYTLPEKLLDPGTCAHAIDTAMADIVSAHEPRSFPVRPDTHCRICNFLQLCPSGREWLRQSR